MLRRTARAARIPPRALRLLFAACCALPAAHAAAGVKHAFELGPDVIENPVESSLMMLGVLAASVLIEKTTEIIEHRASQESLVIVQRVYKEIMILGIISFILVVVILQTQPKGFSIPLFEFCHFLLFFMGIFFSVAMVWTVWWMRRETRIWERAEQMEHDIHAWRHRDKSQDPRFVSLQGTWRLPNKKAVNINVDVVKHTATGEISHLSHKAGSVMYNKWKLESASADRLKWDNGDVWKRIGPAPGAGHEMLTDSQAEQLKLALAFRRDKEVNLKHQWFQKHVRMTELERYRLRDHIAGLQLGVAPASPGLDHARTVEEVRRSVALAPGKESVLNWVQERVLRWQKGDDERKLAVLALAARIDRLQHEIREREAFEKARRKREIPIRYRRARRLTAWDASSGVASPPLMQPPATGQPESVGSPEMLIGPPVIDVVEAHDPDEPAGVRPSGFSKEVHSHRYHPVEAGRQYEEMAHSWELLMTLMSSHIELDPRSFSDYNDSSGDESSAGSSEDSVHLVPITNASRANLGSHMVTDASHSGLCAAEAARPNFGDEELRLLHVDAEHFEHAKVPFSLYRGRSLQMTLHDFLELRWQTWFMLLCGNGFHLLRMETWEGNPPFHDGLEVWVFGVGGGLVGAALFMYLKLQAQFASYYACMMQHEELARAKRWLGMHVPSTREGNLERFRSPIRCIANHFLRKVDENLLKEVDARDTAKRCKKAFQMFWPFKYDLILLQFVSAAVCLHLAATILTYSPRMHELYCGYRPYPDGGSAASGAPTASPLEPREMCDLGWLWSLLVNIAGVCPFLLTFSIFVPPSLLALSDLTRLGANLDTDLLTELESKQERCWKTKLEADRADAVVTRLRRRLDEGLQNPSPPPSGMGSPVSFSPIALAGRADTDVWTGGKAQTGKDGRKAATFRQGRRMSGHGSNPGSNPGSRIASQWDTEAPRADPNGGRCVQFRCPDEVRVAPLELRGEQSSAERQSPGQLPPLDYSAAPGSPPPTPDDAEGEPQCTEPVPPEPSG